MLGGIPYGVLKGGGSKGEGCLRRTLGNLREPEGTLGSIGES